MKPTPALAHRAPDPEPIEEPSPDTFDNPHPHHNPVRMPQEDDEDIPPDHNPSVRV
ncbi:hypothetical protein NX773_23105 [Massilia solisilvae]|uniref:Uncharacterized protein n=1 Tax=Massilia solisilvae TaxID=1811225 RepID=A0ABT2BRB7_9BURK|nr:hypothetical protein [Massilia solisilvae]MCS0611053.1 hypothetical protein [Massilia solisilvae]